MSHSFLVELGTEELPPKALSALSNAFAAHVKKSLKDQDIAFDEVIQYAAPRRLALHIRALPAETPTKTETVWGPPAKIAFDDAGEPSKAALAFAKKNGLSPSELKTANDGKADKLMHEKQTGGDSVVSILPNLVSEALSALPIPKRMRWGAGRTEFVRPTQWLVMLFDDAVVPASILGQTAGNTTRGHRFHCNETLEIPTADAYAEILRKAYVLADFSERKERIRQQVEFIGKDLDGHAVVGEDLLDEVTALVEWPIALAGKFEEEFLSVPPEALISSMKEHQKYFHVVDDNDNLLPVFITVSNIESTNPDAVIKGNEKVIRPRLADAAFFFETDKKTTLDAQREKLKTVVFQAKLGTVYEKTERIEKLAAFIGEKIGANLDLAKRAAQLCKSDLVSNMVNEFSDLQGIAGAYYAKNDGEDSDVAAAMNEQYMPRFAGDNLPGTVTGSVIALADRIDTIAGIFGLGQIPTGSKDPFGLRRASLGALRIMVEKSFDLDLKALLDFAAEQFGDLPKGKESTTIALNYMLDRFSAWYEEENIKPEVFHAVRTKALTTPLDINNRVHAVANFCALSEAPALAEANKRVSNILAKNEQSPVDTIDASLFEIEAERVLAKEIDAKQAIVEPLFAKQDYTGALTSLAELRGPVDQFFTDVMVMTDDEAVRNNRLALLNKLRNLFLEVADISCLVVKK